MGWTGEPRDGTTGLTYPRARDYAPGTGRFTSRDTVEPNGPDTQGYNAYAYTANNPTTRTDPSGHDPELAAYVFALAKVTAAYLSVVTILSKVHSFPSSIRGLIAIVLGSAVSILRSLMVLLIVNIVLQTASLLVKNTMIGRAIVLLKSARLFKASYDVVQKCAARFALCKLLPKLLPKLPCVATAVAARQTVGAVFGQETGTLDSVDAVEIGLERCANRPSGWNELLDGGGGKRKDRRNRRSVLFLPGRHAKLASVVLDGELAVP